MSDSTADTKDSCMIQGLLNEIDEFRRRENLITTSEECEAEEKELRQLLYALHGLIIKQRLQHSLDSEEQRNKESSLIKACPKKLTHFYDFALTH